MSPKDLARAIIRREGGTGLIEVALVDDQTIRQLNKRYRKKDKPTDVLSFGYGAEGLLGEVIISEETARRQARAYGAPYRAELRRLVVHGVLHILGYDHGRKMSRAEKIYQEL
ncbi:MAG: rRNA maturation RNase YbeY [Candidatus Margulisiibacteriota bacterium]